MHLIVSVIPQVKMPRTTLSAIDTVKNKLIGFKVVHVMGWNYLNEATHCISFCVLCILRAQCQCHNIKTNPMGTVTFTLTYVCFDRDFCRSFATFVIFLAFLRKFFPQVHNTFL